MAIALIDLSGDFFLLQSHGFLQCDLIEWIHRMLHILCDDSRLVWLHSNLERGRSSDVISQARLHSNLERGCSSDVISQARLDFLM